MNYSLREQSGPGVIELRERLPRLNFKMYYEGLENIVINNSTLLVNLRKTR